MSGVLAAVCAGVLAWCIGKALGVPVWRDWDIGDRTDLAVLAFFAVWLLASDRGSKPDRAETVKQGSVHESPGAAERQSPE